MDVKMKDVIALTMTQFGVLSAALSANKPDTDSDLVIRDRDGVIRVTWHDKNGGRREVRL